jgi:protein involved in polysaccharide export with SLBB domain
MKLGSLYRVAALLCLGLPAMEAQTVNQIPSHQIVAPSRARANLTEARPNRTVVSALSQATAYGNTTSVSPSNYQIAPNDVLDIRVFRQPDLSTTARVGYDGTVLVPLAGTVRVGGLTVVQASQLIRARLAGGYVPDPQVTVMITEFNHRRFTVLGQVTRSGTYEFPDQGPLDLLQAIGLAGGYTNIANPADVTLKRTVNGERTVYHLNAKKLAQGKVDYDVQVLPGDVITVGESIF